MKIFHTALVCIVTLWLNWHLFLLTSYAATCVGGGLLQFTAVPAAVNFASLNASSGALTNTVTFSTSLSFEDMRNTSSNITIDVTSTTFENLSNVNKTFNLNNLSITSDSTDVVGEFECDPNTGISLGFLNPSGFVDDDLNGISNPKGIVTSDTRARIGRYFVVPVLDLTIPAGSLPGTYRTTLTFTIF